MTFRGIVKSAARVSPPPGIEINPWNLIRFKPAEGVRNVRLSTAFPNSTKVLVDGAQGVRVPMREIALTTRSGGASSMRVYDSSGRRHHGVRTAAKLREPW